jgi:hypothetical protein
MAIWTQTADGSGTLYHSQYGPFAGTGALSIASGPDNAIRVLWSATDGHISLWTMDSYAAALLGNNAFGPFQGASALLLGIGGNNEPRLLWSSTSDFMDLWSMSPDGSTLLFTTAALRTQVPATESPLRGSGRCGQPLRRRIFGRRVIGPAAADVEVSIG